MHLIETHFSYHLTIISTVVFDFFPLLWNLIYFHFAFRNFTRKYLCSNAEQVNNEMRVKNAIYFYGRDHTRIFTYVNR